MPINVTTNHADCSPQPLKSLWLAQHFCVSESTTPHLDPQPSKLAKAITHEMSVGHWSVLRHATASFFVTGASHNTAMQFRVHHGLDFLCQSQRYTGQRFLDLAAEIEINGAGSDRVQEQIRGLFVVPEVGSMVVDRSGKKTMITRELVDCRYYHIGDCLLEFASEFSSGIPFETARDNLPTCFRQAWIAKGTYQDWAHVLDQRLLADTQSESRIVASMILARLTELCPEIWEWYSEHRAGKNKLAP